MTLTAKVATIGRVGNVDGDGTAGSGLGRPQRFRGQGSSEAGYQVGAGNREFLAVAEYDFALDGALTFHATAGNGSGVWIPTYSIIQHTFLQVHTVPVGPQAQAVSLLNDADLVTEANISGAPWATAGAVVTGAIEPQTESGWLKVTTAAKEIAFTATAANTSAGKFTVYAKYVRGTLA